MKCINCGHDVSEEAGCCPNCGTELKFDFSLRRHPSQPELPHVPVSGDASIADSKSDRASMLQGMRVANVIWAAVVAAAVAAFLVLS